MGWIYRRFVWILRTFLDWFSSIFFRLVYRGRQKMLPPIINPLLFESATSLAAKIRRRELSSAEVVQTYIDRIKEVNPLLTALVVDRFDDAMKEALLVDQLLDSDQLDERYSSARSPLLGVPFTVKNSFDVRGLANSAGLVKRKDIIALEDADAVRYMKDAGAILLGLTNVSELCMWWESTNKVFGRTNNPYDLDRIVGGSSGGEACLLSAAGSVIGIGSDIGGSIRMPCFFNGIFGHKPTSSIISNKGQIPKAVDMHDVFLTTGPMCRYAVDIPLVYKVLAHDRWEELKLDEKVDLTALKYYYMEDDGGSPFVSPVDQELKDILNKVITHFESNYGVTAEKIRLNKMRYSFDIWTASMAASQSPSFASELSNQEGEVNIWLETLKWFSFTSAHTLPAIMLGISEKLSKYQKENYDILVSMGESLGHQFREFLGEDGVFIYPPHPRVAPYHNQPLFTPFNFAYSAIFNVLGLPVTQCPLGLNAQGLPLGVQVVGSHYSDNLTLAVAMEIEKVFGGWVDPSQKRV